ncbi:MAG: peptidase, partial [Myxococcales bacterium]|nr:peptidase [Myxococcales bacterium]
LLMVSLAVIAACGSSSSHPATPPDRTPAAISAAEGAKGPAPGPAAQVNPDLIPMPLWPEVKKGTLPNGITYYILKHGKPEKRALLWLAVNAGSVQEDEDQRGLAHFDEHMAFNGTKRFPKDAIVKYLEGIGMRFGADLNAYTSWDETVYQLEVPTDDAGFVGKGLDILRDWAGNVSYDPTEISKESGVVLEEWRLGRGAQMRLFDKHAKALFAGSRYANRITIGLPEIIKAGKPEALTRFYKDWYRPDLMAVIAVGDFDTATMEKEIKARFGDLTNPEKERARPSGGLPAATGTRVSIETDKEVPSTSVEVSNLAAHRPMSSMQDYRRGIGEQLYGAILNERLSSLARKPDAPFMFAAGGFDPTTRDIDSFDRFAQAKAGKVEDALRVLMTEVLRIEKFGITATELERARTNLKRSFEQNAETEATKDSRSFTQEITRNFFQSELMVGGTKEKELTLSILPEITVDELNGLAKKFAGGDNRVIVISGPEGKPLPAKERALAIIDEVSKLEIKPWEDKTSQQALMAKPPTAGKIVKETKNDAVGVTEWTLSNGARVIVKPTDYEVDAVAISGSSPGGEATVGDKEYNDARFADEVVQAGGVGEFDAEQLGKVLAGKEVNVATGISETTESVNARGSAHDLETMFQLIHLRMTAPRKDEQAFNVWKANSIEQLTNAMRSPEAKFHRETVAALYKNNIRRTIPEPTDIEKVNLDKALAFYKARFGDASDFTFVIVGAVDVAKLKPLVETYLASLPAKGRKETEKDLKIRKLGGVVTKTWKLGQEPKASVIIDFHGDEAWSRDKDRDLFILGQVLSIRLREIMREDMGGVYGVGAYGSLARSPHQERSFTLRFGCDPTRVDELVKAAFAEMDKVAKDGIPDDYLAKVKATFLRARETEMRKNGFWASWLSSAYRYGDDPAIVLDPSKMIARMTADNVKAAAKHYLDRKAYAEAVLLPATEPAPAKP